ncbi:hypothetical protein [Ornithinibacillus halotolerans]|uniref:Lipoprotein n=1 Tax=Ornithinibacillus halotolerans TaxID=1274357 RepID=A0A916S462_9BACI|nr:hypothetical protein [Ornithinibacillus halotolerans]GGA80301.1 hypothetical protein GCM10008025_24610 [Ornithinibacillus halotolerans]
MKRLGVFSFIVMLLFTITACASSDSEDSKKEAMSEETKEEKKESSEEESETAEDSSTEYETCKGLLLSVSQEIEGDALAECVVEAMLVQQSGTQIVKNDSGITTIVDFQWVPHFSLSASNGEYSVILRGDTGWMQTLDGRWVQEDLNSTHPETKTANVVIQGFRTFVDPRFIGELLGKVSSWTVVGEKIIPDKDAFTDVAWKLISDDVVDMEISTISDFELYITNDYLVAYFAATGTMGDISARNSNTFTQWGNEVDIPNPE